MKLGLVLVGVFLVALFAQAVLVAPDKVVFLDIGQGDSTLFQNGTRQVLIDGGPGATVLTRLNEEMPAFDKRIEVLILTHPQADHMEGLLHVLEHYQVGMVLLPDAAYDSKLQASWLTMLMDRHIPYRFSWYGQELQVGDMDIKVLGPFDTAEAQAATKKDVNNASTLTRVDYHGMSFLLTGDAEDVTERMLVKNVDPALLNVDVLKAGHHGSKTSNTPEFLQAVSPSAFAISVGKNNRYGHPSPQVLARLNPERVWRTDEDGSVSFLFDGRRWLVNTQHPRAPSLLENFRVSGWRGGGPPAAGVTTPPDGGVDATGPASLSIF